MTLKIELSDETLAKLHERAAAEGQDIQSFVRGTLEQALAGPGAVNGSNPALSADEWFKLWEEWMADFPEVPGPVDDSRESFYAGRSE